MAAPVDPDQYRAAPHPAPSPPAPDLRQELRWHTPRRSATCPAIRWPHGSAGARWFLAEGANGALCEHPIGPSDGSPSTWSSMRWPPTLVGRDPQADVLAVGVPCSRHLLQLPTVPAARGESVSRARRASAPSRALEFVSTGSARSLPVFSVSSCMRPTIRLTTTTRCRRPEGRRRLSVVFPSDRRAEQGVSKRPANALFADPFVTMIGVASTQATQVADLQVFQAL